MKHITLLLILCMFVSGCGITKSYTAATNRNKLYRLEVGMTKEEVIKIMGRPYRKEVYKGVEYLSYLTEWQPGYGDDVTTLAFKGNELKGWGRNYSIKQKERK